MKTKETSTREKASKWFANKSYLEQHELSDKYFESRNPSLLTIEQVEEIWKKETQEQQYSIYDSSMKNTEDCGKITVRESKLNQKQFKQFDESLFKDYIDKFSDEDKEKCFEILMRNLDIQKAELINDGINLDLVFVKF